MRRLCPPGRRRSRARGARRPGPARRAGRPRASRRLERRASRPRAGARALHAARAHELLERADRAHVDAVDQGPPRPRSRAGRSARRTPRARSAEELRQDAAHRLDAPVERRARRGRARRSNDSAGTTPSAPSVAAAIARSNPLPALRRSAGARFTTMRYSPRSTPTCASALFTRTRLSRTAASARPTSSNDGTPRERLDLDAHLRRVEP